MKFIKLPITLERPACNDLSCEAYFNIDEIALVRARVENDNTKTILYTKNERIFNVDLKFDEVVMRIDQANSEYNLHEIKPCF